MPPTRPILMLAFPGFQILDVAGPLQMFAGVNDELGRQVYPIEIAATAAGPLPSRSGIRLYAEVAFSEISPERLDRTDTLLVSGGSEAGMRTAIRDGAIAAICAEGFGRVRRIASVCTGTFFLAAAGLLEGRKVTTHWDAAARFAAFCPAAELQSDAIYIRDGAIWTSAGVTAGIDLALAMIEADHGRDVALAIARRHVVYRMRAGGQSQFSAELAGQAASDDRIARLAAAIVARPGATWTVEMLASEAGLSLRSLSRLFRREIAASPAAFVERARVDAARRALIETDRSVEAIAHACGFGSPRRMHRAFLRVLSVAPTEFRALFKANGGRSWRQSKSDSFSTPTSPSST